MKRTREQTAAEKGEEKRNKRKGMERSNKKGGEAKER